MMKLSSSANTSVTGRGPTGLSLDYLGHAGFVFRHPGGTVLLDPWFFPAFAESWFPYPDNRFLLPALGRERFDYLYISHVHEDHFDRRALAGLPGDIPVLCPAFRSRSLQRELSAIGFTNLILLRHGEDVELSPGVRATMILDTSHKEDSGLLIDADGFRFLDLNDCHPQLSEIPRDIDLLAAQHSGAMWYPNCYSYSEHAMQEKVAGVRANLLETLVRICYASDARWYLPSAGPACFLDPVLSEYNDPRRTIFARWDDVADEFARACPDTRVVRADPGQGIVLGTGDPIVAGTPTGGTDLRSYAARRHGECNLRRDHLPVTTEDIRHHFTDLQRRNRPFVQRDFFKRFVVRADDSEWTISIGAYPLVDVVGGADESAGYFFDVPGWLLRQIVDKRIGWEEALLSMRIRLRRDPDVFDAHLFGLLRYGERPSQTRQMLLDSETSDETIERDGLRVQRYCPHAGEDLTHADVNGCILKCPRHHWMWDTRTGECVAGGSLPLRVERLAAGGDHADLADSVPAP